MGRVFDAEDRADDSIVGLTQLCNDWIAPDFIMAEIGVYRGVSTALFSGYARRVFAVDSWLTNPDYHELGPDLLEGAEILFDQMLLLHPNVVKMKGLSHLIAEAFGNESLDMIYIDGDHSEKAFRLDMESWVPKVKKGGVISGHDYGMIGSFIGHAVEIYPDSSWAYEKS